jgi:monoamine oxidase
MKKTDPAKRVEKALSVFRSTVDELEAAARHHDELAEQHTAVATEAHQQAASHRVAANTAFKVASKIAEFLP